MKSDGFTDQQFLDWARTRKGKFKYDDNQGCPYFLFLQDQGRRVKSVAGLYWTDDLGRKRKIGAEQTAILLPLGDWTYEKLVERLERV